MTLIPAERDVGATAVKVGVQKEWMDGSMGAGGLVFRDRPQGEVNFSQLAHSVARFQTYSSEPC